MAFTLPATRDHSLGEGPRSVLQTENPLECVSGVLLTVPIGTLPARNFRHPHSRAWGSANKGEPGTARGSLRIVAQDRLREAPQGLQSERREWVLVRGVIAVPSDQVEAVEADMIGNRRETHTCLVELSYQAPSGGVSTQNSVRSLRLQASVGHPQLHAVAELSNGCLYAGIAIEGLKLGNGLEASTKVVPSASLGPLIALLNEVDKYQLAVLIERQAWKETRDAVAVGL